MDHLTGLKNVHVVGEHLVLPGYEDKLPTLEIYAYDCQDGDSPNVVNGIGLAHLAFEVDNVVQVLKSIRDAGGDQLGEIVTVDYSNRVIATFVYAKDPEGNIIELQSWKTDVPSNRI